MKPLNVIGINSGTSLDGVDVAICNIDFSKSNKINFLGGYVWPYPKEFKIKLQKILAYPTTLKELCLVNQLMGDFFCKAVFLALKELNFSLDDISLIGSHGHTFWHEPNPQPYCDNYVSSTLQLGEASVIAYKTGKPTVCDFRILDMAAGGQGAPLISFMDYILFGADNISSGILNIGGIANISFIDSHNQIISSFDTGPGNMIIDYAMQSLYGLEYDHNGEVAANGKVNEDVLNYLMTNHYFKLQPPKTTGRELFGLNFAQHILEKCQNLNMTNCDIIATLTAFTAKSIASAYINFIEPKEKISRLILSGGGAYNCNLVSKIKSYFPHSIKIYLHDEFGIPTKYKEAVLFGLLAYSRFYNIANNLPKITGAFRKVVMGKLIQPYEILNL